MKYFFSILVLNILFTVSSFAAGWEKVDTSPDGKLHAYIDDSINKSNSSVVTYWQKRELSDGGYEKALSQINCNILQRREHEYYRYDKDEKIVEHTKISTYWHDIVTGSTNYIIYLKLCKKQ